MNYNFTPLAPSQVQARDPNFLFPDDAAAIAASLMSAKGGPTSIEGVQAVPPVPNTNADGRVYILLNFSLTMDLVNSVGRLQSFTVPFSEVAGLLLDQLSKSGQPWKFIAVPDGPDKYVGDVEREG